MKRSYTPEQYSKKYEVPIFYQIIQKIDTLDRQSPMLELVSSLSS